jgi:hypothetical protein
MPASLRLAVAFASTLGISMAAHAQTCPPVRYVSQGIGDGCSVYAGQYIPNIAAFKGAFTPSCDRHDLCYSTLGTDLDGCDNTFLSDMRSACRSSFNPLWAGPLYLACLDTANQYYLAVRAHGALEHPYPAIQRAILDRSRMMQAQVANGDCGTAPELTNLYTQGLIDQINNAWLTSAGRLPSIYEFFSAINGLPSSDLYVDARAAWQAALLTSAQAAAAVRLPAITVSSSRSTTRGYVTLRTDASADGALRVGFWGTNYGPEYSEPLRFPLWNATWYVTGYATAINRVTGVRNLKTFRLGFWERGSCGPYLGKPVYDPENPVCLQ